MNLLILSGPWYWRRTRKMWICELIWTWMNIETALWVAQYTVTLFEFALIFRFDDFSLTLFLFCECLNSVFVNLWYLNLLDLIWLDFGFACLITIACGEFWFRDISLTKFWDGGWWWRFGNSYGASLGVFMIYSGFSMKYRQFYYGYWY